MKDGCLHAEGCGVGLGKQDGQDPRALGRDGSIRHGNVRSGVVVVLAGDRAAPRDVSEHLTPTAVVIQVLLKIVVVVIGVEDIIREAMFRGADGGYLLTDRKFAGSDTLATSYALSCALRKIGADVIVAGRQAIDGDTAQVGPQVAEKLGLPQVTYAEEVLGVEESALVIRRRLERGVEVVKTPLPAVVTVNSSAAEVRPQNARRVMKYKYAMIPSEIAADADSLSAKMCGEREYLRIVELTAADIECDEMQLGLTGSPTKVKKIENVVFQAKEAKRFSAEDSDINDLMVELISSHTLG